MVLIRRVLLASTYRVKPVYSCFFRSRSKRLLIALNIRITCRWGLDYIVLSMVALRMVRYSFEQIGPRAQNRRRTRLKETR